MHIVVTYDSYFINTQNIAGAVAESAEKLGAKVRTERIYQLDFMELEDVDLIVVGAPTHNRSIPRPIKSVLKRLPRDSLTGIKFATFDTRYRMPARKSGSAAKGIARMLGRLGGEEIAPPESFFVQDRRGPLFEGEIGRAMDWMESILERWN